MYFNTTDLKLTFHNLFKKNDILFWIGCIYVIWVIIFTRFYSITDFIYILSSGSGYITIALLYIWLYTKNNIKNNLIVIKIITDNNNDDDDDIILFRLDQNKKLNFIIEPDSDNINNFKDKYGDDSFVKDIFNKRFSKELDDNYFYDNINKPLIYNRSSNVYYLTINGDKFLKDIKNKPWFKKNYKVISIKELKKYNKYKNNYKDKDNYSNNVLSILFDLNSNFIKINK